MTSGDTAALDQTIVSTALPTTVADLGGAGHMFWVVTSCLPAGTVATVPAGKHGDLVGRKELPLRDGARSHAADVGEGFPAPGPDRAGRSERAISDTMRKAGHDRTVLDEIPADSGMRLNRRPGPARPGAHHHRHEAGRRARSGRFPRSSLIPVLRVG